jgi:ATP-binding protein involved in chromosome partitioning
MSDAHGSARVEAFRQAIQQQERINQRLSSVKAKVAVYSGKGGVGKTTVAVNLACVLARQGKRVGILDADIDCPNVARMMKATNTLGMEEDSIIPAEAHGVKIVSMAFIQPGEEEAIVWRGPLIHKAITELLEATDWGELDYLLVDLPPGTSDAPLTIMQNLPLDGFVVVTTPQELARLDARRSISMIRKLNVEILGVVENFTGEIFGSGTGEELSREVDVPFLGSLSLRADYRDDSGPVALSSELVREEYEAILGGLEKSLAGK